MILHPDIMIYELLELYFKITDDNTIEINNLKESFLTLQNIINIEENQNFNYDFNIIFTNFYNNYQEYLDFYNNTLIINEDLSLLLDAIFSLNEESILDETITEYIENISIYKALNLEIPHLEMADFFNLNKEIIEIYISIAKLEMEGITSNLNIFYLKKLIKALNHKFANINYNKLTKLKMCCADLNSNLDPEKEGMENSSWHLALFGTNQELTVLNHAKIAYLNSEISYILEDYEDYVVDEEDEEELLNKIVNDYEDNNELSIFLTYLFINICQFINSNSLNDAIKNNLILRKYLLLSTPELNKLETYYLQTGFLNLEPPIINNPFTKTSFNVLFNIVMISVLSLDYNDEELKDPTIYSEIILHSLLIKTYLDLSLNENYKKQIINTITTSTFYNYKYDYNIIKSIIDNIILNNTTLRQR